MENKRLLEIKCEADPQFAPAMHHNRIPLIRSLRLVSLCETELRDVRITVTFSPAFAAPYETLAALIEPHETVFADRNCQRSHHRDGLVGRGAACERGS